MTNALPYCGHRFGGRPEPKPRFDPDADEKRRNLSQAMIEVDRISRHLEAMLKARERLAKIPGDYLDELDARLPHFPVKDPEQADVDAARAYSDELEAELDEVM